MKSRIWRMAGVGVLCLSVNAQLLADERDENRPPAQHGAPGGEQREHQGQGRPENAPPRPANVPNRPPPSAQPQRPQNEIIRGDNSRQFEHNGQNPGGQWQNRPQHDPNQQVRPAPVPQPQVQQPNNLPIQGRPDTVRQTQEPQRGYYQDIPGATTTTSIGRLAARALGQVAAIPTTTAGRAALMAMAMAGAPGRSTAPGM